VKTGATIGRLGPWALTGDARWDRLGAAGHPDADRPTNAGGYGVGTEYAVVYLDPGSGPSGRYRYLAWTSPSSLPERETEPFATAQEARHACDLVLHRAGWILVRSENVGDTDPWAAASEEAIRGLLDAAEALR